MNADQNPKTAAPQKRRRLGLPFILLLIGVLILAACGGTGAETTATQATDTAPTEAAPTETADTSAGQGTATAAATPEGSPVASGEGISVTIGSKLDVDGQLNAQMYALLLQAHGFDVTTKLGLGQTPVLDQAIKSGEIDIYPEFTGTALSLLSLPPTQDAQEAYEAVKTQYAEQFQLTWLDPAYELNDSYAICTSQQVAEENNLTTIEDLQPIADQLTIAAQQDGIEAAIDPVESAYDLQFGNIVQLSAQLSFDAVTRGDADLNVCYTTDPAILVNNFVVLEDTMNVFPIYNPAPVVRNELLEQAPQIADILNPLQPHLTTDVIVELIKQVSVDHKSVEEVARTFLQQEGLLTE